MPTEPYASAKFKLTATFQTDSGAVTFDDVISMSASFALNTIPTASLVVAVGNRVDGGGGLTKATIHDAKEKLKMRDPVTVTLEILPGGGDTSKLRPGRYKVFEGFYAGIGYQRSHNHANYVLNLIHWLDDLNNSSAINGNWFPGVPFDYAQQAVWDRYDKVSSFGPAPSIGVRHASKSNLNKDLWAAVIKPIFEEVSGFSGTPQERRPVGDKPADVNNAAKEALAKIPGAAPKYTPLSMKEVADDANIAHSISTYFGKTMGESFAQNSIWSKLIGEYAADFLFAISPAVEWAVPIPFCGGVRWTEGDPTIEATEYSYASFSANMSQIIESVNVYHPLVSETALKRNDAPPNLKLSFYRPCAEYPGKTNQDTRGLKLFKSPPRWATEIGGSALSAANSAGKPRLSVAPDGGNKTLPPNVVPTEAAIKAIKPVIENFAKHWYMTEILKQRYGELSGPLRFDIAPGSIVKIEMPIRDRAQEAEPNEHLYVSVMSVSFVINAERATAGTSFAVAHTKTKKELDSMYATDKPPLYDNKWSGGPLAVGGTGELAGEPTIDVGGLA